MATTPRTRTSPRRRKAPCEGGNPMGGRVATRCRTGCAGANPRRDGHVPPDVAAVPAYSGRREGSGPGGAAIRLARARRFRARLRRWAVAPHAPGRGLRPPPRPQGSVVVVVAAVVAKKRPLRIALRRDLAELRRARGIRSPRPPSCRCRAALLRGSRRPADLAPSPASSYDGPRGGPEPRLDGASRA